MSEQVDVIVIGLGVAGEEVAGRLAQAGLSVVGVEAGLVGGECPYWGCVPTKMMIRASGIIGEVGRAGALAGRATIEPDWSLVAQRIRAEATDTWDDQVAVDRFEGKGGRFVRGHARITGPGEVTVGDRVFTARRGVVLATGTTPVVPPVGGLAGLPFWTNRDAVQADQPADVAAGDRWWRDRRRVRPGLRPFRQPGHHRRGSGSPAAGRGARGRRGAAGRSRS